MCVRTRSFCFSMHMYILMPDAFGYAAHTRIHANTQWATGRQSAYNMNLWSLILLPISLTASRCTFCARMVHIQHTVHHGHWNSYIAMSIWVYNKMPCARVKSVAERCTYKFFLSAGYIFLCEGTFFGRVCTLFWSFLVVPFQIPTAPVCAWRITIYDHANLTLSNMQTSCHLFNHILWLGRSTSVTTMYSTR